MLLHYYAGFAGGRKSILPGVKTFREMNFVQIDRPADVVIISAGGYPKDINMYQAHKAIYMASKAVRKEGSMLFFAGLEEGYGHKTFASWAKQDKASEQVIRDFETEFCFGAHKLYYRATHARDFDMFLYSRMNVQESRRMYCEKFEDVQQTFFMLEKRYGKDFTTWIIPQGGIVLPV